LDGTHIPVVVPADKKISYIGRKEITTTNVTAVYDFNMCFTFVWVSWKGSAHNTKIFNQAMRKQSLHFPLPLKVLIKVTDTIFHILDWAPEQEKEMKYSTTIILALDVQLNAHLDIAKQDEKSWVLCHCFS
ncbi:hypothetical protein HN51_003165, partial [Arachis hypogaea]